MALSHTFDLNAARPVRPSASFAKWIAGALIILAIALTAYYPAMRGGFIWDDDVYVQHNASLRTMRGLWNIWAHTSATPQYYPLVHTSFWIEYQLWGAGDRAAVAYKITNVLLHVGSAIILWRLLLFLEVPGAYLAAILFTIHPVQVESVAWITERKNVLSGFFYLLALWNYLKLEAETPGRIEQPTSEDIIQRVPPLSLNYLIALFFFVLALLSKTVVATLPAAILLILWWKRGRLRWRDVIQLMPFFIAAIAMGSLTAYLERTQVGAHGPEWNALTPIDRILIAARAICFYAQKFFWPVRLSFIYPRWNVNRWGAPFLIFPLLIIAAVTLLWLLRGKIGRGPLAALLFYIGTLFPALGFANVYPMRYSFVADHFQYLACISLCALTAAVIAKTRLYVPIAFVLTAMLASLTFARGMVYRDRETLWRDTLAKNPNSWMAHTNLGHALHARGDDAGAREQYQLALQDAPDVADTHLNAAISRAIAGDFPGAITECRQAIKINPTFVDAWGNLAKAYLSEGDVVNAEKAARHSLQISPQYPLGHYMMGRVAELSGNFSGAEAEYTAALSANPDDPEAHFHLANVLVRKGEGPAAIAQYKVALTLDPQNKFAWVSLGDLLRAAGNWEDAKDCFERALTIDPTFAPAIQRMQR